MVEPATEAIICMTQEYTHLLIVLSSPLKYIIFFLFFESQFSCKEECTFQGNINILGRADLF